MKMSESISLRLRAFALVLITILASYLSASINTFENGLIHITLLAALIAVGLATNLWGGVAASAVAAFAIILINQYLGVFARQYVIMNIASELFFYTAAGPLAGSLAETISHMQYEINHWLKLTEDRTIHDDNFGTLKPEWAKIRLEEETLRAKTFLRPLSITLMKFNTGTNASRSERIAALSAVIRIARSETKPPVVISYIGNDQILLILPEHTAELTHRVLASLEERTKTELYFPAGKTDGIGKPLSQMGQMIASTATLEKESNGEALLEKAKSALA